MLCIYSVWLQSVFLVALLGPFSSILNACFTLYSFYDINFVVNINFNLIFIAFFLFQAKNDKTASRLPFLRAPFWQCSLYTFFLFRSFNATVLWYFFCCCVFHLKFLPISHSISNIVNTNIPHLPRMALFFSSLFLPLSLFFLSLISLCTEQQFS